MIERTEASPAAARRVFHSKVDTIRPTYGFEDAEFKRFATSRSKRVMVAATSEKFGTAAPHSVLPVALCECLVVEHDADAVMLAQYRARGCRTVIAEKMA